MTRLRVGDKIEFRDRANEVRGVSPMSITPPLVLLVDAETGERIEVPFEELEPLMRGGAAA